MGDEDETKVQAYLQTGELYLAKKFGQTVGVALIVPTDEPTVFELKNLAVLPEFQRQKIATKLVEFAILAQSTQVKRLIVGTGDADLNNMRFYLRNGFRFLRIEPDFFLSYPQPIYAEGISLKDMVYFYRDLS